MGCISSPRGHQLEALVEAGEQGRRREQVDAGGGELQGEGQSVEALDISIRAAVNTGEGLVTLGARPQAGEGMVTGDVVNTASRL